MKVLFVCLGNICRSPSAEGVFRRLTSHETDSAGTAAWHVGKPPYGPMQAAAMQRGIDLSDLRARQIAKQDFGDFDLIIAMDESNMSDIEALRPKGNGTPVRLFTDFAPNSHLVDVPDPYYTRDFDGTLDLIEQCATGLAAKIG
ncbi:MAG: low molecular weight protein-tyrosine-phosphatase [Cognatishimia sp.]